MDKNPVTTLLLTGNRPRQSEAIALITDKPRSKDELAILMGVQKSNLGKILQTLISKGKIIPNPTTGKYEAYPKKTMKSQNFCYTSDQRKAIALLKKQPMSRDELLKHFPHKDSSSLIAMLRNPRESGKIVVNKEKKFEVFSPSLAPGVKVIQGNPQPYSPPPSRQYIV